MPSEQQIQDLLRQVAGGQKSVEQALSALRNLPFEDLGDVMLDHHRPLRQGFCEVVLCQNKTPEQVAKILTHLAQSNSRVLATRADADHFAAARHRVPDLQYHKAARAIWLDRGARPGVPGVVVVAAGTSDLPVAEEAALTLRLMGHEPQQIHDVGVAGLHRLLHHLPTLQSANVVVAVAGMEAALPSVVAGLISAPVIGVPTSVGYGTSFGGIAALLAILNSCSSGVATVNIDNGFGAGYVAATINRKINKVDAPDSKASQHE